MTDLYDETDYMPREERTMTDLTPETVKAALEGATPGPWAYEPHGDTMEFGVGVCYDLNDIEMAFPLSGEVGSNVMVTDPICPEVDGQANARLIALAPDLAREYLRLKEVEKAAKEELAARMDRYSGGADDALVKTDESDFAAFLATFRRTTEEGK